MTESATATIVGPDGTRRIAIHEREDRLLHFEEEVLEMVIEADPDFDIPRTEYWTIVTRSGLHDTLDSLEIEARSALPWLANINIR